MGCSAKEAQRFSTRKNATIYLHPSNVSFQIPEDWLTWDSQFHNNIHLTPEELQKVHLGEGQWDYEYGEVVNSVLPFEHCAAHVGGEGWGNEGVSFGDLQMRVYVTNLSSKEVLKRISGPALATAKRLSRQVQSSVGSEGPWQKATIQYSLFYEDYGGIASVEFYLRPISHYQLVFVFMGSKEDEKQSILRSVTFPGN
jgi:hypothetical protein